MNEIQQKNMICDKEKENIQDKKVNYDISFIEYEKENTKSGKVKHPNEDSKLINTEKNLFVIADGVTRGLINDKYPDPSPAKIVSEIVCKFMEKYYVKNNNIEQALKDATNKVNKQIKKYNIFYLTNQLKPIFLPGATMIACSIDKDSLHVSYIGDGSVILLRDTQIEKITKPQTTLIQMHKSEFNSDFIRTVICNNKKHKYGYGVLTGEENALNFLEYHTRKLRKNDIIIITSDGYNKFENTNTTNIKELLKEINKANENINDDKSIIILKIS